MKTGPIEQIIMTLIILKIAMKVQEGQIQKTLLLF